MLTESRQRHSEAASAGGRGRVPLVTGMSGAGSAALKTLEDIGYEAFDNPPLSLLPALIKSAATDAPAIVVGADLRTRGSPSKACSKPSTMPSAGPLAS